ncbi:helix-turn-helix domain-containing protein [Mycobacterium sp. URHB0021]
MTEIDRLYTKNQTAELLATSTKKINRLVLAGDLAAIRHDGRVKFRASELERYINELPSHEPRETGDRAPRRSSAWWVT